MKFFYRNTPYFVAVYFLVIMLVFFWFVNEEPFLSKILLAVGFVSTILTLCLWYFVNRLKQDPINQLALFDIDVQEKAKVDLPSWEQIPDHGWDQEALRMYLQGFTYEAIGKAVGKNKRTVRNRISILRHQHGEELIPPRKTID